MVGHIFDRLLFALTVAAAVFLAFMTLSVDFEVISRYFFNEPTKWVIDFTEYTLIYILFLSSAWVLSKEKHITIDILFEFVPAETRRRLNILASIIGSVSCGIFFCFATIVTFHAYEKSEIIWHSIIIPKWPVWIILPIGSLLLTIQFIRRAILYAKKGETSQKESD